MKLPHSTTQALLKAVLAVTPIISACNMAGIKPQNEGAQKLADAVQTLGETITDANKARDDIETNGVPVMRKPTSMSR